MSYQVLIEWVNTRLEKWLCSNFSDHDGNIKLSRCDRSTAFCLRYFIVFMAEVTKQAAIVPKTEDCRWLFFFSPFLCLSSGCFFLLSSTPHNPYQDNIFFINIKSRIAHVFTFLRGRSRGGEQLHSLLFFQSSVASVMYLNQLTLHQKVFTSTVYLNQLNLHQQVFTSTVISWYTRPCCVIPIQKICLYGNFPRFYNISSTTGFHDSFLLLHLSRALEIKTVGQIVR